MLILGRRSKDAGLGGRVWLGVRSDLWQDQNAADN